MLYTFMRQENKLIDHFDDNDFLYRGGDIVSALGCAFYGLEYLTQALEDTTSTRLRDAILLLLEQLVCATANAREFVRVGGATLLVRIAASIHTDRLGNTGAAMVENLLEAGQEAFEDDGSKYRVWLCDARPGQRLLLADIGEHVDYLPAGRVSFLYVGLEQQLLCVARPG